MLDISSEIYISDSLIKKKDDIIKKLRHGEYQRNVYVIYRFNNIGRLSFMDAKYFINKYIHTIPITVIGLVQSYDEALLYLALNTAQEYEASFEVVEDEFSLG